jgi:limonene-1,2-epoxide hydrolase
VCGTFEVHDGVITVWRDRFDLVDFSLSWLRGLGKALVRGGRGRADTPDRSGRGADYRGVRS